MTTHPVSDGASASDELTIPNLTFIDFLLDETGSMGSCANATMIGYDDFVAAQRSEGGECYLTLAKFDSSSIRTPYENLPISMVPPSAVLHQHHDLTPDALADLDQRIVPLVIIRELVSRNKLVVQPKNVPAWSRFVGRFQAVCLA